MQMGVLQDCRPHALPRCLDDCGSSDSGRSAGRPLLIVVCSVSLLLLGCGRPYCARGAH